jgi:hypothetical protein
LEGNGCFTDRAKLVYPGICKIWQFCGGSTLVPTANEDIVVLLRHQSEGGVNNFVTEDAYVIKKTVAQRGQMLIRQKLLGENGSVRRCVVMVKQPRLFSPTFRGDVFARFHAVTTKRRNRTQDSHFGLLGPALCLTAATVDGDTNPEYFG